MPETSESSLQKSEKLHLLGEPYANLISPNCKVTKSKGKDLNQPQICCGRGKAASGKKKNLENALARNRKSYTQPSWLCSKLSKRQHLFDKLRTEPQRSFPHAFLFRRSAKIPLVVPGHTFLSSQFSLLIGGERTRVALKTAFLWFAAIAIGYGARNTFQLLLPLQESCRVSEVHYMARLGDRFDDWRALP